MVIPDIIAQTGRTVVCFTTRIMSVERYVAMSASFDSLSKTKQLIARFKEREKHRNFLWPYNVVYWPIGSIWLIGASSAIGASADVQRTSPNLRA
jgi:hypothetical protein